jgi:rhodanese-related sulfurtransferase
MEGYSMEIKRISLAEVRKRLDRGEPIFFIDTRNPHDWGASDVKIPGARRIHYSELMQHLGELPHDRLIVTYCT